LPTGRIECICGCMYSGKTEEMIRRLRRVILAHELVVAFKPDIDDRYEAHSIASHGGDRLPCLTVADPWELYHLVQRDYPAASVVGVDEVQFMPAHIVTVVGRLAAEGRRVIVAGLDMDFRGEPFGPVPYLIAIADEVTKLKAVCVRCHRDANRTQRLVGGVPAHYSDSLILVGGAETYEARCADCHEVPGHPLRQHAAPACRLQPTRAGL
jgi:thymidine kinase